MATACGGLLFPEGTPPGPEVGQAGDSAASTVDSAQQGEDTAQDDGLVAPDAAAQGDGASAVDDSGLDAFACAPDIRDLIRELLDRFGDGGAKGSYLFRRMVDLLWFFQLLAQRAAFVDAARHVDCTPSGVARGACTYDPRDLRLDVNDVHYSNALNAFVAPSGDVYDWAYIPDRNEWLVADAARDPAGYALVADYERCLLQRD
jgi:hypothetical protein